MAPPSRTTPEREPGRLRRSRAGATATTAAPARKASAAEREARRADEAPAVVEELLIEEVSIDGMCGVY